MSNRTDRVEALIRRELAPVSFAVRDESHLHAGHNPEAAHGGTHYRLEITSARFNGLSRIAQHRLVMAILQPELDCGLHAVALTTRPAD